MQLWSKGLSEGGMLKDMQKIARVRSRRSGSSMPRALALAFVSHWALLDGPVVVYSRIHFH